MNEKNENINTPWYALRFFSNKNHKIERFFENEKLTFFIPMVYKYKTDKDDSGSRQRIVVSPACPHLLFLKKDRTEEQIVKILSSYNEPLMLYKYPGSKDICEISSVEMLEFRMMCDIGMNYNNNGIFDIIPPCDDIEGKEVIITKGAFKGVRGRIRREKHRSKMSNTMSKNYYVIKNYSCVSVKIRVINGMFRKL